jgi:HD-like signal output (HDOD) protein/prolyl-tRNA editing enzyme YbaK/EbsC (Cys-tRNA(Pro) deacylase)
MRRSFVAQPWLVPTPGPQDTEIHDFFKDGSVFAFLLADITTAKEPAMGLPANIRDFLDRQQVTYETLLHPRTATLTQAADACDIPVSRLVRAVILVDAEGLLMAVLPADHVLDFDALCALLQRNLELVPGNQLAAIFDDCEPRSYPPLAPVYDLDVIIDSAVEKLDVVTFEPGVHTALLQVNKDDFHKLLGDTLRGSFSRPAASLRAGSGDIDLTLSHVVDQFTPARVRHDIEEFHELPALPATAAQILRLAADPMANARQLADIIEQDPGLSAQVLRYANSSLYGYAGRINNLQTAIARVLGFEFVMNLALGLSIGQSLRIPQEGPFGLDAFWKHSVYAARLVEQLAGLLPQRQRLPRGTAYLAGLLQNLGRLVLGHTFQPEFYILNRFAQANPDMPTRELERHVLGVTHDQIGAWLMEAWGLPGELVIAVRNHHDESYWDEHASYAQLVLIANRALAEHGLGETDQAGLPAFSLEMLGLKAQQVIELTNSLFDSGDDLEDLARRLAA